MRLVWLVLVAALSFAATKRVATKLDGSSATLQDEQNALRVAQLTNENWKDTEPTIVQVANTPRWSPRYLASKFGRFKVVVKAMHRGFAETLSMPISLFAQHSHEGSQTTWVYVMDETFLPTHPELYNQIPKHPLVSSSLFYLLPQDLQPWDCLLLWGTPFSRSTLHVDPYNWTGTNLVLYGKKLWRMVAPGNDHLLQTFTGESGFPLETPRYQSTLDLFDDKAWKRVKRQVGPQAVVEFEQNVGDMVFIPTGWWHQAFNPEESIAIASQIMSPHNHKVVLQEMKKGGGLSRLPERKNGEGVGSFVQRVFDTISPQVIERGRKVMEDIRKQLGE